MFHELISNTRNWCTDLWLSENECRRRLAGDRPMKGDHLVVLGDSEVPSRGDVTQPERLAPAHEAFSPPTTGHHASAYYHDEQFQPMKPSAHLRQATTQALTIMMNSSSPWSLQPTYDRPPRKRLLSWWTVPAHEAFSPPTTGHHASAYYHDEQFQPMKPSAHLRQATTQALTIMMNSSSPWSLQPTYDRPPRKRLLSWWTVPAHEAFSPPTTGHHTSAYYHDEQLQPMKPLAHLRQATTQALTIMMNSSSPWSLQPTYDRPPHKRLLSWWTVLAHEAFSPPTTGHHTSAYYHDEQF